MKNILAGFFVFLSLIFFWKLIVAFTHLPAYILPSPEQVFSVLWQDRGLLFKESIPTLIETLIGLGLGFTLGCTAAILMSYWHPAKLWMMPMLLISQALPTFAIAPLLVIWFGFGMASKIVCTIMMLFFPVTSAFYDGLNRTNKQWIDLASTMRANAWREFLHLKIPNALPSLASGIRVATAIAPIGAIIGEWVGASHGLGFLVLNSNARMQIDLMFAALFVIVIFSLSLYFSVDFLLKRFIPWQQAEGAR